MQLSEEYAAELKLLRTLADQGNADAQIMLGYMYDTLRSK
jgi:TPR repeat protein